MRHYGISEDYKSGIISKIFTSLEEAHKTKYVIYYTDKENFNTYIKGSYPIEGDWLPYDGTIHSGYNSFEVGGKIYNIDAPLEELLERGLPEEYVVTKSYKSLDTSKILIQNRYTTYHEGKVVKEYLGHE